MRKILLHVLLLTLFTAVAATAVGIVRGNRISAWADSVERGIAPDGTIYEIISEENNRLSLRRITPQGLVTSYFPLPLSDNRGMYTAYHVVGRLDEELFLYKYETSGNTPSRREEAVVAYNMSNGASRTVAQTTPPGGLDAYDVFYAQHTSGGAAFLGYLHLDSNNLTLNRIDLQSGAVTKQPGIFIPFRLAAFSVTQAGELFALSQDSRVYMREGEKWHPLFEPQPGEAVANMTVGEKGEVFLFIAAPDGTRDDLNCTEKALCAVRF